MLLTTLAALLSAAAPDTYVLAVGNNQSPVLGRPQLAYADDDAVRATEVFETLFSGAATTVELLADLDADTQRLYPDFAQRATPPRREAVMAAFARMGAWAKERRAAGRRTRGYFIFAGHGDIAAGEGFLELLDGRLTAGDFQQLLAQADTDEMHVVLDSCNSWFVLSPRKPGGRRFPTPADATRALVEKLPKVGVILSTSAEAEVYEWSELQSGIFSYALRSGLSGAADANGDGDIAYNELAAFVDSATRTISNPNLRPHIFARAPGGGVQGTFASLGEAQGVELTVKTEEALRLRVRDGAGVRSFDAHLSAGTAKLYLPRRLAEGGGVVERQGQPGWSSWALPSGRARVELGQLQTASGIGASRGATEALQALFTAPFGPKSVSAWEEADTRTAETEAFGVSQATVERVGFMLGLAEKRYRGMRLTGALTAGVGGLAMGFAYGYVASTLNPADRPFFYGLGAASSAGLLATGLLGLLLPSPWERQARTFSELVSGGHASEALVGLDRFLDQRLTEHQVGRVLSGIFGGICIAAGIGMMAFTLAADPSLKSRFPTDLLMLYSVVPVVGGTAALVGSFWTRGAEEDFVDVLRQEGRTGDLPASLSVSITPLPSGVGAAISGRF